jgi:hypothetical protein
LSRRCRDKRRRATSNFQRIVGVALLSMLPGSPAGAHRLDEYLQAARVDLDLTRVEVRLALTPGVDVAETIVREIDVDRDGVLSQREQAAYVSCVLEAVHLDVDGHTARLQPTSSRFPAAADLKGGEGTIMIRLRADVPELSAGAHRVHLANTHHAEIAAYLANVLVPQTPRIEITDQRRNANQSDLTIDYVMRR